jgi:hypothetical protein
MPAWLKIVLAVLVVAPGFQKYVLGPLLRRRSRRLLKSSKPIAIAALRPAELATIAGVVAARDAMLTSPVGRQACIGFRTSIDYRPSHGAGEVWLPAALREACGSFSVTDDSGTATVEGPLRLELDIDDGAWANLPATAYAFLEETAGPSALANVGDHPLRFQEALLKPGDRVIVVGRATSQPGQIRGSSDEPVVVADVEPAMD